MSRGRVEILACYDEIVSLLDSGNTYKYIHNLLYDNSKISVSYLHFCSLLRNLRIRKRPNEIFQAIYEARCEFDKKIHNVKRIQTQVIDDRQRIISETTIPKLTSDKNHQKHIAPQRLSQPSPQKKPTFEIVRLGDDAFENMETT